MKTILSVFLVILATSVWAQTQITSPTVSGNWTLAGSPYVVNVNINIAANSSLTIEPGVVVKFKATTHLIVDGSLIANGTASQYITFQADDTTGWANENITLGGWNGIHFMAYSGTGSDNSALSYCIIKDTKYGYSTSVSYANTLSLFRKIKVAYCDIYHNTAGTGFYVAGNNISISTSAASDTIELDHCKIYDNTTVFGILYTGNNGGGFTSIHHCDIHDNSKGSPIWGVWNNVVIEYNDIHHNTMINDSSPIKLSIGVAKIRFNKVHHNICDQLAAIGCRSGLIDIDNNLICNNQQLSGSCGATGGGGGIHLSYNEGATTFNDTYYRVRNNVIANNYSAYGGGGIYVFTARAEISNNTIVNNTSGSTLAKGIMVLNPLCEVYIRNNLFKGNTYTTTTDSTNVIGVYSANKIQVDNNYLPTKYSQAVYGIGGFAMIGDTIHNVIGNAPQLIAPTLNNAYSTDATASNFGIQTTSPCVDKGDSTGTSPLAIDYAGNPRIGGLKIDIGAYEVGGVAETLHEFSSSNLSMTLYPNPASSKVQIDLPFAHAIVSVFDLQGHLILEQNTIQLHITINTSQWSEGIYFIRSMTEGRVTTQRLVVQH